MRNMGVLLSMCNFKYTTKKYSQILFTKDKHFFFIKIYSYTFYIYF